MLFNLEPYLPFNAFVVLAIVAMGAIAAWGRTPRQQPQPLTFKPEQTTMTTYTPTRIAPLALARFSPRHWQFVDTTDNRNAQVGPIYCTKAEAFADLESYSVRGGWVR